MSRGNTMLLELRTMCEQWEERAVVLRRKVDSGQASSEHEAGRLEGQRDEALAIWARLERLLEDA
jgi:hypothetical protein